MDRRESKAALRRHRAALDAYLREARAAYDAGDYYACGVAMRRGASQAVAARKVLQR